jgi:ribosomal 30S subunit maturation factor RimM
MDITDLIPIGTLILKKSGKGRGTTDSDISFEIQNEYQHLIPNIDNVFFLFKDHRVRYGSVKCKIQNAGNEKSGAEKIVDIPDVDLLEEILTQNNITVCLDPETIDRFADYSEYYDPVGMKVIWNEEVVATIIDFFFNGAHDVYELKMMDDRVVLIPDVDAFVIETNIPDRYIRVVDLDQFFF